MASVSEALQSRGRKFSLTVKNADTQHADVKGTPTMTLIYLIRHGETDWNRERRIQGSTDISLNDVGRAQAARTGRLLRAHDWGGIASSPLSRAFETALIIAGNLDFDPLLIESIPALGERRYGAAEGLDQQQLLERFPPGTPVPGRETRHAVAARVIPAMISFAERHPGSNLIVTTHGGAIRSVLERVAPDSPIHLGVPITNGSVHSFQHVHGGIELVRFDDPIELESVASDCEDLLVQNAVEQREAP